MFKQYFSFVLGISQGPEEKYLLVHCFQNGILGIYTKRDYGPDNGILSAYGVLSSLNLAVCTSATRIWLRNMAIPHQ